MKSMIKLKHLINEESNNDDYFYHATKSKNLPKIVSKGLLPSEGDTTWGGDLGKWSEGKVFVSKKFSIANYYGNVGIWKSQPRNWFRPLLRVRIDIKKLHKDMSSGDDYYSEFPIKGPFDIFIGEEEMDNRGDIIRKDSPSSWRRLTLDMAESISEGEWDEENIEKF